MGFQDWRRPSAKGAEDVVFESDVAEGMPAPRDRDSVPLRICHLEKHSAMLVASFAAPGQ